MNRPSNSEERRNRAVRLRDEARRARRLLYTLSQDPDRQRLTHYAEELEETAARLEQEAGGGDGGKEADR